MLIDGFQVFSNSSLEIQDQELEALKIAFIKVQANYYHRNFLFGRVARPGWDHLGHQLRGGLSI